MKKTVKKAPVIPAEPAVPVPLVDTQRAKDERLVHVGHMTLWEFYQKHGFPKKA